VFTRTFAENTVAGLGGTTASTSTVSRAIAIDATRRPKLRRSELILLPPNPARGGNPIPRAAGAEQGIFFCWLCKTIEPTIRTSSAVRLRGGESTFRRPSPPPIESFLEESGHPLPGVRTASRSTRWLALAVAVAALAATFADLHPPALAGMDWTLEVADGDWATGHDNSLALGPDGWPRISYWSQDVTDLRYAWRDAGGWHNSTVDAYVPGSYGPGWGSSLAVDAVGIPHISYGVTNTTGERSVWYAFWNTSSSSWTREYVGGIGFPGSPFFTSLTLNTSGSPRIA